MLPRAGPSLLLALAAATAVGPAVAEDAESVFERYSDAVVKVRVTEVSSGAKAVIGSGFFVAEPGLVATNYHVVSRLIDRPEHYRAQCEDAQGARRDLEVLAVDVVHDLALARAVDAAGRPLGIAAAEPPKGAQLFAFGYPHDLGLSIVEGTHNGLLERGVFKKIHFTASINPGMSGGPALSRDGRVVGVNVATAGNQVSFLVPARALRELVAQGRRDGLAARPDLREDVRRQMLDGQEAVMAELLAGELHTVALGEFRVPSEPTPAFECWADAQGDERKPYRRATHRCSSADYVFLSEGHSAGMLTLRHELVSSDELNGFRFTQLYSDTFARLDEWLSGGEDDVTRYHCTTDAVDHGGLRFKVAFCARGYKKLAGLYDVVQKSAVLGVERRGLVSTLALSGVTFENGRALARRFLEAIRWEP